MEQILLDYDLPKETVTAIMMLYKNTKLKVRSPDGDTDFFDIVTGVLQEDKTEFMCFNQRSDVSTLNGRSLKLMDKFTYQGSSVSSSENDINMQLAKEWTAIDRLSVIWKLDLSNRIKRSFFHAAVVSQLLYGCTT